MIGSLFIEHHYASSPSIRFLILAASWPVCPKAPALVGDIFLAFILSQFRCWPTFPWYFSSPLSQLTQVHCFLTNKASSYCARLCRYPTTDCTLLSRTKMFFLISLISPYIVEALHLCLGLISGAIVFLQNLSRIP